MKIYKEEKIDIVILAGGKGTRINKFTKGFPKPMIQITKNLKFLDILLNNICKYNINKIFILAGYKGKKIYNYYNNKLINLVPIECIIEKKPLGTAGSILQIKKKISQKFIIMNGDTIFDIDLDQFKNKNLKKNEIFIALTHNSYRSKNAHLSNLHLKNKKIFYKKKNSKLINGGIYLTTKEIFKFIGNSFSFENDVISKLINKKKAIGEIYKNFFIDIGTPKNYLYSRKILPKYFNKPAIYLDRDGTINKFIEGKYVYDIKKFVFLPKTLKALKILSKYYYLFIVTNQSGIGKGIFTINKFINLHKKIKSYLTKKKIFINEVQYCPYHPYAKIKKFKKNSNFRKPGNLMIEKLKNNWIINNKKSMMFGDKKTDEICANKSKVKFFYVNKNLFKTINEIKNKIKLDYKLNI